MDKTLAQAVILFTMLGLASAASLIYVRYAGSNTPLSQSELQQYTQTAASLFYTEISEITSDPPTQSFILYGEPSTTLTGWVCANFMYYLNWADGQKCSDMRVQNQTVTRSFTAKYYYQYYTVMVYIPLYATVTPMMLQWWLDSNQPTGWIWYGLFIAAGDALTSSGAIDIIGSYIFYWSSAYTGGMETGTANISIPGGYTIIILVQIFAGFNQHVTYGFTMKSNPQNTVNITLPSKYYEASISQQGIVYGPRPGPVATFKIPGTIQGQLRIYYNNTLIEQQYTTFTPGENIYFYPNPYYPGTPQTTLLLNLPVQVTVARTNLTVAIGDAETTITLNATLIGGGKSSAWTITLVGCQETCVVAVEPAQTNQ